MSSRGWFESWAVLSTVLKVHNCLSSKPGGSKGKMRHGLCSVTVGIV